jgi:hypothetical protein
VCVSLAPVVLRTLVWLHGMLIRTGFFIFSCFSLYSIYAYFNKLISSYLCIYIELVLKILRAVSTLHFCKTFGDFYLLREEKRPSYFGCAVSIPTLLYEIYEFVYVMIKYWWVCLICWLMIVCCKGILGLMGQYL